MSTLTGTGIGRLGRDPETRDTQHGPVVSVSVAFDHGFGERKTTTWIRVSAWGKVGETLAKLEKGNRVGVSGELWVSKWGEPEDERQTVELKAHNLTVIDWPEREPNVDADPRVKEAQAAVHAAGRDTYPPRRKQRTRESINRLVEVKKEVTAEAKATAGSPPAGEPPKEAKATAGKVHAPPYKDGDIPF